MSEEELKKGCGKDSGFGKIPCGTIVNIVPKNSPLENKRAIKVIKLCSECKAKLEGYQKAKEDNLKIIDEFEKENTKILKTENIIKKKIIIADYIKWDDFRKLKKKLEGKNE